MYLYVFHLVQQFDDAIEMCLDHHITLTEDLAERMSPPKGQENTQERIMMLEKLGECAYKQGSLHLATKKFTQAGSRIKVLGCFDIIFSLSAFLIRYFYNFFYFNNIFANRMFHSCDFLSTFQKQKNFSISFVTVQNTSFRQ